MQSFLFHRTTHYLSALLILIAAGGCQQKLIPLAEFVSEPVTVLPLSVPGDTLSRFYNGLSNRSAVAAFYRDNGFRPVWIAGESISPKGDSLTSEIRNVRYRGLLPQNYHLAELSDETLPHWTPQVLLRRELLLTDAFFSLAKDLRYGRLRYAPDRLAPLISLMKTLADGAPVKKSLDSAEPTSHQYHALKAELRRVIDGADAADAVLLKSGLLIQSTALLHKVRTIELNMERWRWERRVWPDRYVYVNIPSLMVEVWNQGTSLLQSRVIVGKPDKPTPELTSTIQCFVTYPYWHVPRRISVEELLPKIQRDSTFIRRYDFDVLDRTGKVLNADTLPWSKFHKNNFPVILRQREGPENSLGVIKFVFDNPYAVFLHDTNAPRLFRNKNRALSHGCVRVEKAAELAHLLVTGEPGKKSALLTGYLDQKLKHTVDLKKPIPVYLRYFTAAIQNEKLVLYDDIYKKDEPLIRQLNRISTYAGPL